MLETLGAERMSTTAESPTITGMIKAACRDANNDVNLRNRRCQQQQKASNIRKANSSANAKNIRNADNGGNTRCKTLLISDPHH
jgi:hypothetical protein